MTSSKATCRIGNYCYADFPNGTCVDNAPLGPYDDLGSQGARTAGYLMGYAITASADFTLKKFGILAKGTAKGNVKIGLYMPEVGVKVWTLVAGVNGAVIAPGRNEYLPDKGSTTALAAGTYWMLVSYSAQVSVGQDKSTTTNYVSFTVSNFDNPLPATISNPTANMQQGPLSNYYLLASPR